MGDYNTSSSGTNYTSLTTTTDQIRWVGGDIICKNKHTGEEEVIVCNGKSLTVAQNALAVKLCELTNATDISSVIICSEGDYFTDAFKKSDSPLATLLKEIIDAVCAQQILIEDKADKDVLNTAISIEYCCCAPTCSGVVNVSLATHIKNILDCLCAVRAQVVEITTALNEEVATRQQIVNLQQQVQYFKRNV
jgi:hypothetical protein